MKIGYGEIHRGSSAWEVYSVFDSALYSILEAKWLFPFRGPRQRVYVAGVEVKAAFYDLQTSTCESNMLQQWLCGARNALEQPPQVFISPSSLHPERILAGILGR